MAKNDNFIEIQPVSDALEIIGGKWKFPIIFSLCHGKKRYKELEKDLNGISPKALTNALKDLEINGLVKREIFATVPVTVEYSLTQYGKDLKPVLLSIQEWGKKHRKKIMQK
ncbi:helix-turn-helix transcriptional regulator [Pseudoflavitalea sp. X16]|uniref:winged helix-turn-helix transcriptional regulator n=1 Tax=Paraflavitalea devenefica TaxID=2716334 RepID=UPI001420E70A|nr:helix-turn-helix domain-containing protein [Paraflavitalea devenefica]NII29421.1 helix-turn-helix transcriptional regulator [Paraflavitalea devenefica]